MSTSKRAKEARQKKLAAEKRQRELEKSGFTKVAKKRKKAEFKPMTDAGLKTNMDEHRAKYKSVDHGTANTAKKASQQYTGTFVKGIGTMHKSNAVPVVDDEFMIALSQMRRN